MGISMLLVVVLAAAVHGAFAGKVASLKGHNEGAWFFAGVFFGPIGLIAAVGLPDLLARPPRPAPAGGARTGKAAAGGDP